MEFFYENEHMNGWLDYNMNGDKNGNQTNHSLERWLNMGTMEIVCNENLSPYEKDIKRWNLVTLTMMYTMRAILTVVDTMCWYVHALCEWPLEYN